MREKMAINLIHRKRFSSSCNKGDERIKIRSKACQEKGHHLKDIKRLTKDSKSITQCLEGVIIVGNRGGSLLESLQLIVHLFVRAFV
jgi:hypothetical protein